MEMIWIWLAIVVVCLIVEFITSEMISIWFSVGGIFALILSAIDIKPASLNLSLQFIVFVVISALCLIFLRRICLKLLRKATEKTNLDVLIGKKITLKTAITENSFGTAEINGIVWNVKAEEEIEEKTKVEIIKIQGNSLIVKKEEK